MATILSRTAWKYGSIFISLAVVASQICEITRKSEKIRTYSSSRSSKVIDLGANRKRICNFLLVILDVSLAIFEILTHKPENSLFSHPALFDAPAQGEPVKLQVISDVPTGQSVIDSRDPAHMQVLDEDVTVVRMATINETVDAQQ